MKMSKYDILSSNLGVVSSGQQGKASGPVDSTALEGIYGTITPDPGL